MAANLQIKKGDCLYCLAAEYGLTAETIWNHQNNVQLKTIRKQIDAVAPGDTVFVPDVRPKEVSEPTDQVHKFWLKSGKHRHWIEIELVGEDDKPVPGAKYRVTMPNGIVKDGALDQNGWARVEDFAEGNCQITFPELDETVWEFIETTGPKTNS